MADFKAIIPAAMYQAGLPVDTSQAVLPAAAYHVVIPEAASNAIILAATSHIIVPVAAHCVIVPAAVSHEVQIGLSIFCAWLNPSISAQNVDEIWLP